MDPRLCEIPPYSIGNSTPIRRFNDLQIQASIERAVRDAEASGKFKHVAAVAHYDIDGKSLTLSVVAKAGEHVTIVAAAYKPYNGPWEGEAAVRFAL